MPQIVFTKARLLPLLMVILPSLGTLVSYCVAVRLDHVEPFLPFVSHAAGYPPQGALFTSLIEVASIVGVWTILLRYAVVKEHKSFVQQKAVTKLNNITLWTGCLAFLGLIILAVNPVGFPAPNKQDYMLSVFATHNVGALGASICFSIYVLVHSYLTYNQKKVSKKLVVIHILLSVPIVTSSLIILGIFYFVVRDVSTKLIFEKTGFVTLSNVQYTFFGLMAALLEWTFVFFLAVYFATFSIDFKHIRIVLELQPKSAAREVKTFPLSSTLSANGRSTWDDQHNKICGGVPGEKEKKRQ